VLKNPNAELSCPVDESYLDDLIYFEVTDGIYEFELKNDAGEVKVSGSFEQSTDGDGRSESALTGLQGGLEKYTKDGCMTVIFSY